MTTLILSMQENFAHGAGTKNASGPDFSTFWESWPRKTAKKAAERAWARLSKRDQRAALEALPKHVAFWRATQTGPQFVPHPATWLNGARWEDEVVIPEKPQARAVATGPAWWTSHVLMEAKAREVGLGIARPGETSDQYRARIQQALAERDRFGSAA